MWKAFGPATSNRQRHALFLSRCIQDVTIGLTLCRREDGLTCFPPILSASDLSLQGSIDQAPKEIWDQSFLLPGCDATYDVFKFMSQCNVCPFSSKWPLLGPFS